MAGSPDPPRRLLQRLRYENHAGRVIRRHRALRRLEFRGAGLLPAALLVGGAYALLVVVLPHVTAAWGAVLEFWLTRLGLSAEFDFRVRGVFGQVLYAIPYPLLDGALPAAPTVVRAAAVCGLLMLLAFGALRGAALPFGYFVWAACVLQLLACVAFWFSPQAFTHSIASHVANGLEFVLVLVLLTPLLLAFSYYVFDHRASRKLLGTLVIIGGLVLVAPYQYLLHAALIEAGTLLVMPLLYALFGLLFDAAVFVALYAWVVSWEP